MGFPVQCIGVPKTIDNDLPITDNCPGFGSVAKYVAVSTLEASLDVESMASSSTRVFILEVMGRHAGWIAAAAGVVAREEGDPPHVILFPEVPFREKEFLAKVRHAVENYGYCTIVVSEGVRDASGGFLADAGTRDAFGHAQLGGVAPVVANIVRDRLGYKYHWAVADYLQRSARHIASKTDVEQAYAVGAAAVRMALEGKSGVMPIIQRVSSSPYRWKIGEAQLGRVANREKMMPKSYIAADGFGITPAARRYLAPLILGEDYPPYDRDGLPRYVRLKKALVRRKLDPFAV
jgi:6-phosphofructokinase 1